MTELTAVIDADVIAYTAAAAAESDSHDIYMNRYVALPSEVPLHAAKRIADTMLAQWVTKAGADTLILAFSGPSSSNFRRGVHKLYKSNRTGEKPACYVEVVAALQAVYPWVAYDCLEGDDVLGMAVTDPSTHDDHIAVSTDKDILTLPGKLCHIRKDGTCDMYDRQEQHADWYWMKQTIMGDSTDGYKGAPGIGEKGATARLGTLKSLRAMWDVVIEAYKEQHLKPAQKKKFVTTSPYQEALMNARCARILRHGDFNHETGEVKLWVPA